MSHRVIRTRNRTRNLKKVDRRRNPPYAERMTRAQIERDVLDKMPPDGISSYNMAKTIGMSAPPDWWRVCAVMESMTWGKGKKPLLEGHHDGRRWIFKKAQ